MFLSSPSYHMPLSPIIISPHEAALSSSLTSPLLSSASPPLPSPEASISLPAYASSPFVSASTVLPLPLSSYRNATAPLPSPPPMFARADQSSSPPHAFIRPPPTHHHHPTLADTDEDDEYYLSLARRKQLGTTASTSSRPQSTELHMSSPGQGIRRLAESFLDSLGDESPLHTERDGGVMPRAIQLGSRARVASGLQHQFDDGDGMYEAAIPGNGQLMASMQRELMERKRRELDDVMHGGRHKSPFLPLRDVSLASTASALSLSRPPSTPPPSTAAATLHQEILHFAHTCQLLQQQQAALREDLSARTRRAVKSVWPQAEVDLVGSVSAGVALPKSDLDFVVFFPVVREGETSPRPAYTYTVPVGEDGHASLDAASISKQQPFDGTTASLPPQHAPSTTGLVHHFAHAGSLIKLLGGRKKSKLLFRSTKIQVFKDINLIRLRDGCSGISMDLWFPTSSYVTLRSQQHTLLIGRYLASYPYFYPLSVVVKSFMQQQMLNSGYSGLGSYGVLLMIVRFLQWQQTEGRKDKEAEERKESDEALTNLPPSHDNEAKEQRGASPLSASYTPTHSPTASSRSSSGSGSSGSGDIGHALCDFFRFYCEFDYANKAVDVRGDGCFFDKPEMAAIQKKAKQQAGGLGMMDRGEEDDEGDGGSEDEREHEKESNEWGTTAEDSGAAGTNGADGGDSSSFTAYTLVIQDPQDSQHYIICHHRALRNMVQAFMKALSILDPDAPLPSPPAALMAPVAPPAASAAVSSATGYGGHSLPPSAAMGRTTSDIVYPSSLITLPSHHHTNGPSTPPSSTHSFASAALTPFHRLLDVQAAYAGPAMKECPSVQCRTLHPPTLCPIQNKVCFTCGFMFVKAGGGGSMKHHHAGRGGKAKRNGGGGGGGGMGGMGGGGGGGMNGGRRLNGHGMHMQLMQLGHPMAAAGGHMQTAHAMRQGRDSGGARKFTRSTGFHTEPSSPTYAHAQYRSPASASTSLLNNQPNGYTHSQGAASYNGGYASTSPPMSAAHLTAQSALNSFNLTDGRSTSSNGAVGGAVGGMHHPHAFARTQSHPAQSPNNFAHKGQSVGGGGGQFRGQPAAAVGAPAGGYEQQLPYMGKGSRYRSSSANVHNHNGPGGGGMGGRRGGYGGNATHVHGMHQQQLHHPQQQQQQPPHYAHHNQYQQ